jgi:cobalt/nickel transport system permease protein
MACMSCLFLIVLTTPMPDLLGQLRRWHVPALLVSLMALIYRFIFVLLEESDRMQTAQACRLGQRNFRTALQSSGALAGQLFFRAYLRTDRVHAAMLSRGYTGVIPVLERPYERQHGLLAGSLLGCAALIALTMFERMWL